MPLLWAEMPVTRDSAIKKCTNPSLKPGQDAPSTPPTTLIWFRMCAAFKAVIRNTTGILSPDGQEHTSIWKVFAHWVGVVTPSVVRGAAITQRTSFLVASRNEKIRRLFGVCCTVAFLCGISLLGKTASQISFLNRTVEQVFWIGPRNISRNLLIFYIYFLVND